MIQAFFGKNMMIRKSVGTKDNSGDYNVYEDVITVEQVTLKGNEGKFHLAIWNDGEYSYSISVEEGMSQTELLELVNSVQ